MSRQLRSVTPAQNAKVGKLLTRLIAPDCLNLENWTIVVAWQAQAEIAKQQNDPNSTYYGICQWDPADETALITLAYPWEIKTSGASWERTLLHEVLHIRFGGHRECEYSIHDERMVNAVEKLLAAYLKLK